MITLESSKLFGQLPVADLKELRGMMREMHFVEGQEIFKAGDPGDGLFVVKHGVVQISALLPTGVRCVFARMTPGDVFGEMTLVDEEPRSANATAVGETTVYFVPREPLAELLQRSAPLCLALVREISTRLREFSRQHTREVLQAERLSVVGRFASCMVHDLRNPLTVISAAAELACLPQASPEARAKSHDRIARQVERISSMVNDILEYTRGSQTTRSFALMDYAEFIRAFVAEMQPEVAVKSVVIELENPPPAVKLAISPKRLTRVIHNLVHNAVDAMPQGGRIKIRFAVTATEVVTEIEDGGKGIAPEIAARLFEPFATYGKARGTGLGLSISQRIVQDHQGKISARNQPGGGAVFTFTLPWKTQGESSPAPERMVA